MNLEDEIKKCFKLSDTVKWETGIYFAENFDKIKDLPGLYSWHYRLPEKVNKKDPSLITEYPTFYSENEIQLEGNSNFSKFDGFIKTKPFIDQNTKSIDELKNVFEYLFLSSVFFSPPLYVGMSQNIAIRIKHHKKVLNEVIFYTNFNAINLDNDDKEFGERVGKFISSRNKEYFTPNNFFLKTLYMPKLLDNEIKTIEYFVNRSFKPKFGKI